MLLDGHSPALTTTDLDCAARGKGRNRREPHQCHESTQQPDQDLKAASTL